MAQKRQAKRKRKETKLGLRRMVPDRDKSTDIYLLMTHKDNTNFKISNQKGTSWLFLVSLFVFKICFFKKIFLIRVGYKTITLHTLIAQYLH